MKQIIIDCMTGKQRIEEVEGIIMLPKTQEELRKEYEDLVISFIRDKYSESEEFAIHRKKLFGIDNGEFNIYHEYVENCKIKAREIVYGGEVS